MNSYTFEVTEDHRLRFTLEDDDRIDVYESTEEINRGRDTRVIRATIVGPPRARQITFENGTDRASMEQLGATIHVRDGQAPS